MKNLTRPTNHPQTDFLANKTLSKPQKTITRVEHDQKNVIVGYLVKGWENHETLPESLEVHIPQPSLAVSKKGIVPNSKIESRRKKPRERNQTQKQRNSYL